jgi:SEC-C motif-containing protein
MTSTRSPSAEKACPCGSGQDLASCCLPYIQGKKQPVTAEQLLRSRYTAFTLADVDYILNTHHSRTRHEVKREEIEEWAKASEWLALNVVQSEAGREADTQGTILFCAQYSQNGEKQDHWEQSYFEKEDGAWRFLDAKGVQAGPLRREGPKIGRNDPCHCGSGQKYKKCHGK